MTDSKIVRVDDDGFLDLSDFNVSPGDWFMVKSQQYGGQEQIILCPVTLIVEERSIGALETTVAYFVRKEPVETSTKTG